MSNAWMMIEILDQQTLIIAHSSLTIADYSFSKRPEISSIEIR
jgi:hypothetical protein